MTRLTFLTAARTYSLDHASHERIRIEQVEPEIDGGRYPIKREVGDIVTVSADIFRDGHEKIAADLYYKPWYRPTWDSVPMEFMDNDRWTGSVRVSENTRYDYSVAALQFDFQSWSEEVTKKFDAGLDVRLEIAEGLLHLQKAVAQSTPVSIFIRDIWDVAAAAESQAEAVELLSSPKLALLMRSALPESDRVWYDKTLSVKVDRIRARYAAWYELFPRSAGKIHGQSGTFDDVIARLDYVHELGFDTLYFPPIHPIGHTNRKGPKQHAERRTERSRRAVCNRQRSRRPRCYRTDTRHPGRLPPVD